MPAVEPDNYPHAEWLAADERLQEIEQHLPWVRIIAAGIYGRRVGDSFEFQDVFQWGVVGLLEAMERYRPETGVAFKTYAEYRIRGEILDHLSKTSEIASQAFARKQALQCRASDIDEKVDDPFEMLRSLSVGLAIGFMLEGATDGCDDEAGQNAPYASLAIKELRRELLLALERLPDGQKKVLKLHYLNELQFAEIAQMLDLSRGRISQLHKEGLDALRAGIRVASGREG